MKYKLPEKSSQPKQNQLVDLILEKIWEGQLPIHSRLPSINTLSKETGVSRDTIIASYRILQDRGIIKAVHGSGYYVISNRKDKKPPLFLLFDVMNSYKEVLYRSFSDHISNDFECDIFFHYYNPKIFRKLIEDSIGNYSYYVVMPHFNQDISLALKEIPSDKLLLIDNVVPQLKKKVSAIYQPFEKDMYNALKLASWLIQKYKRIILLCDNPFQFIPDDMVKGFKKFCFENKIVHEVLTEPGQLNPLPADAYIAVADADLVRLIRHSMENDWKLGKDMGIISYDETPLKEVLAGGISVISTDFRLMGETAARMIKEKIFDRIENPSSFIRRSSL